MLGILSICNSYSGWIDIFESSRRDGMFSFCSIFFVRVIGCSVPKAVMQN